MKNSRKMRGLLVMLIAFAFCFLAEPVKADDRTALDGIYVEDISVSGMTEEQITQAVNDKIEQLKPSVINLSAGEQNAQVTAGDLGLSCANPEVAREAVTIGQEGNVLKRFLTQNRLKNGETVTFSLKYTVDGEAARQAVENNTAVLNREATDATLTREDGEFIVNPGQTGCSVNVDESTAKVVNYLTTSWRGGIGGVELVTEETPAGVIYVLKNRSNSVNIDNQNRLHPFYMVYISNEGEVICDHLSPKQMLDKMRFLCKGKTEPIPELYRQFNKETRDGRNMSEFSKLLGDAIASIIEVKEESDIDSFLGGGQMSFLSNEIKGLDDFELICFLVVR